MEYLCSCIVHTARTMQVSGSPKSFVCRSSVFEHSCNSVKLLTTGIGYTSNRIKRGLEISNRSGFLRIVSYHFLGIVFKRRISMSIPLRYTCLFQISTSRFQSAFPRASPSPSYQDHSTLREHSVPADDPRHPHPRMSHADTLNLQWHRLRSPHRT